MKASLASKLTQGLVYVVRRVRHRSPECPAICNWRSTVASLTQAFESARATSRDLRNYIRRQWSGRNGPLISPLLDNPLLEQCLVALNRWQRKNGRYGQDALEHRA